MNTLVIGPSEYKSKGGMATVIKDLNNSKILQEHFHITTYASYIDGILPVRIIYSIFAILKFRVIYNHYELFHVHVASNGSTFRKMIYVKMIKRKRKNLIIHIHGAEYMNFFNSLNNHKKKKVIEFLQSADIVFALSQDWKNQFVTNFNLTNCHVLNNGIDTLPFQKAICNINKNKNKFAFIGRLGKRKGTFDIIEAMKLTVITNPEIVVYLAGDGEIDKANKLIKLNNLEKNIIILGWLNFEDKINLLSKVSTVILPSYNEGLPMVILEGMAAGKAIISTSVGAIPEVISKENGKIIRPGDIKTLAQTIITFSKSPDYLKKISENNISKIKNEYSVEKMHTLLAQYYNQFT